MIIVLGALLVLTTGIYEVEAQICGPNNIVCLSDTTYQFCFVAGTQIVVAGGVATCPTGTVCNDIDGPYACVNAGITNSPTTTSTTSTTPSTTPTTGTTSTTESVQTATTPACAAAGTYASDNCNQYYECVVVMWWYELVLQTCPAGQAFNSTQSACVTDSSCDAATGEFVATTTTQGITTTTTPATTTTTTSATTTTTTPATSTTQATTPTCTAAGTYATDNCNEYYECVAVMWWYQLVLQTCPSGQSYDSTTGICVADSSCIS